MLDYTQKVMLVESRFTNQRTLAADASVGCIYVVLMGDGWFDNNGIPRRDVKIGKLQTGFGGLGYQPIVDIGLMGITGRSEQLESKPERSLHHFENA